MRIVVDHDLCEGNAVCEALAPMAFDLDEHDQARVIDDSEDHRMLVERAAESCPRLAITVQ